MKHQEIKQLLPEVFQTTDLKGSPMFAILEALETLTEPDEEILLHISDYFNPYITPEKFLPFLTRWVDLDRFFPSIQNQSMAENASLQSIGSGRLRELIIAAPQLSKLRGTSTGLQLFLETACGITGFEIDENISSKINHALAFHITITAPRCSISHRALIERIIEQEKPANVTYNLEFSPQKSEKNDGQNS